MDILKNQSNALYILLMLTSVIQCYCYRTFNSGPGRTQSDGALFSGHVCFVSFCIEYYVLLLCVCDQVRMHSEGVSADSMS